MVLQTKPVVQHFLVVVVMQIAIFYVAVNAFILCGLAWNIHINFSRNLQPAYYYVIQIIM